MTSVWMRCFSKSSSGAFSRALAICLAMLCTGQASAHKASDSYLQLQVADSGTTLRVDVALRDLDVALDLDTNADGKLTWGEVKAAWPGIERYLIQRVRIDGCEFTAQDRALEKRADGTYAALTLRSPCVPTAAPVIHYAVMTEVDPTHRGIARIELGGKPAMVRILTPSRYVERPPVAASEADVASAATLIENPASTAAVASQPTSAAESTAPPQVAETPSPFEFLREGMRHILTGYDHVLFLICLLLPSVMRRTATGWRPVDRLGQAVLPIFGIVTAFTLAHSLTLGLAASGKVSLSPSFIEPAIAVTIVLAALDNLWPIFRGRRAIVTFCFGLIHGFGFAGVLAELNLPTAQFAWALLQFNVGLELGQIVIVVVATSILFALRRRRGYAPWIIRGGSILAIAIAAVWFVERVANVSLMPV